MKIKSPSLLFNSEARLMAFCGGARQIGSMTKATPHEGDSDLGSGYRCNKQRANWALGLGGVATHLQILTFIILALFLGRGPLYAQPDPPSRPILFVHGWCGSAYDWAPFFDPANQYRLSALFPAGLYTNTDVYLVEYNRKAKTIGFWKEDNPELGSKTKLESVGTTVPSDARFFALNFIDPDPSSTNPLDPVNVARSSVLNKAYEIAVVAQYIEQLTYSKQINIIAHSMGGLDSRAYVENLASVGDCYDYGTSAGASFYNYTVGTCLPGQGAAAYGGDIANIITLDTPHNGSPLANSWASALSGLPDYSCRSTITTNSSELVPGNVMLDSLNYNTLYAIGNNDTHPNNLTTRIQAIEDYDSDNNPPWLTSGLSDGVVLQTSQSVVHNVLGSANSAYLTDITREYADVTIALTPQCNVNIGFQTPFPMIHPLSCLGALSFTEVTAAQQLANDTVPWISSWSVTPSALSLGNSFTIQYTATDLSASTLSSTQFWRAPDTSGQPGPWKQLPSKSLSGNGPTTVTSTDTPLTIGLYWYGSELLDAAGNGHWQQSTSPVTVTAASTGTYTLTVNSVNPASGVGISVSPADNDAKGNGTTSFVRTYNQNTQVTLTALSTAGGNSFSSWTGCDQAPGIVCIVTMTAAKTVTANYTTSAGTFTLTVNSSNPSSGVGITVLPTDKNGSGNGTTSFSRTYNQATQVTLTAPATAGGNTFSSWTGCDDALGITCTVTMNAAKTVTANYTTASGSQIAAILLSSNFTLGSISVVTQGAPNLDFNFASGGTCTVGTAYSAGQTCTVEFSFTPRAPGQRMGAIVLVDGSGNVQATEYISGIGTGPEAVFAPGIISTVAGNGTPGYSGDGNGDGNAATSAELNQPLGVVVDSAGNIYIASYWTYSIRKVNASTGLISTVAGNGTIGFKYSGDGGAATSAEISSPDGVALDSAGNIYISVGLINRILKVNVSTGLISTVAGNGTGGYNGDGIAATSAELNQPVGVVVDSAGNIYIADRNNQRIRKVSASTGLISTVAGNGYVNSGTGGGGYNGDGITATNAELNGPCSVAVDSAGSMYIADSLNQRIRKVNASTGLISTVAGNGYVNSGTGGGGYNGDGIAATSTELNQPVGVVVDSAGNIYIADRNNQRIRKVSASTGLISTVAGNGYVNSGTGGGGYNGDGITATNAELYFPNGIAEDSAGSMYIADSLNQRIRKVSASTSGLSFATTTVGSTSGDSPQTVTLWNNGNAALTFPIPSSGNNPSVSTNFTLNSAGGTACPLIGSTASLTGSLAAGTSCTLPISFAPTSTGSISGSLVLTDNNLNVPNATQTISFSGTSTGGTVRTTPTMTVTPSLPNISTAQALTVTVAVSGGGANPTPTGSVTLSGGGYTSAATTLSSGSATINIPAGSLATGSDTLTASYTPDSSSSSTYNTATGTSSAVTVTQAKTTPTVTVTPSASSITTAQPLTVTVAVSGGTGNPTPTGSVTLSGGGYTSAATTLNGASAMISIPAGSLTTGTDTLTVSYTPDSSSSSTYNTATGTSSAVTVTTPVKTTPTVAVTPFASSITTAQVLSVTITVTGGTGSPTPTGSVTLSGGGYTSVATTLSGGSATISIPAKSLTTGADTLTVSYTPDSASSSTYNSATGSNSVTVTAPAKTTPTVTVTPSASSITTAQALSVTVAVSGGTGSPTPTGSLTLTSGTYTSAAATLSSGSATINIPAGSLATGNDTLTVSYTPDSNSSSAYNSANGSAPVAVTNPAKTTPTVTVTQSSSSITTTQPLTVTVAVSGGSGNPTPTGSLTLTGGGYTSPEGTLSSGSATISIPAGSLAKGGDTLTATYTPDSSSSSTYNAATGTSSTVTVTQAKTAPTVTVTPSASSITTAQALSVTVAVSGGAGNQVPSGSVTLSGGGYTSSATTLSAGNASINIPAGSLATGSDTLTASYTPDTASSSTYNTANGSAPVAVTNPAKTTPAVTVTPSASSITTAQVLSVTVTVNGGTGNPTPTGSVTLSGGGYTSVATTLSGGSATISIPAKSLTTGADTLTVSYTPDLASSSTYNSATGSNSVTVTAPAKTTPTVTVTPSVSTITTAQALSVTVAVSDGTGNPTPTGSLTLTSGTYTSAAATLSSGSATISIPAGSLATGSDLLTVSYTPDSNSSSAYNSATGSAPVAVTNPAKTTPLVTVTPGSPSITTAQPLSVTVAVSGGTGNPTPTGSVTLSGGGYTSPATTLTSGNASISIPAGSLATGPDTLTVSYTPDSSSSSTYNSATGSSSVTVTTPAKTTPTVTVTPSASSITPAQSLTVTVAVSGATGNPTPTGSVTLSSGSYSVQQTLASGAASFTIAAGVLGNGSDTLTASYSGDAIYAVASSTTTVTVEPVSISTTTPSPVNPGSSTTSTVTLTGSNGYSGTMNLSCLLTTSPAGAQKPPTCALNPASVTLASGGSGTTTLTVNTTAASTNALARPTDQHLWKLGGGGAVLAAMLLFGIPLRRRRWTSMLALLLFVAASGAIGCGGGGGTGGGGGGGSSTPATTAGNYSFTVAATDSVNAKITASTTISVTVQ